MSSGKSVITIGTFDGVHVGHAALVRRARAAAGEGVRVVAMSFDPHPAAVLRPGAEPARLTTFERRAELLRSAGADEVVRLEPTKELLGLSPEAFFSEVVAPYGPVAVVEGEDFRFGRGRAGGIETLRALGRGMGFDVHVVGPVEVALSDHTVARASSSMTRWLIEHGRVRDAAAVLGRPYEVSGTVERGDRRGRTIGYPTANVRTECLAPGDGVYAGVAHLEDGRRFAAAISVGTKPTFGEHARAVEAFLLRSDGGEAWAPLPGLAEYGWGVRLAFLGWVREQVKFGSLEALLAQMARDGERVREIVDRQTGGAAAGEGNGVLAGCR